MGRPPPPWREDGSAMYPYNSPSLSGPSPAELMATSYCLVCDDRVPFFVASYDSQSYDGDILTHLHKAKTP
jgi:hypothetical protein